MSKDKEGGLFGGNKHEPRKDLHEDDKGHPHHKQADHVRHHHRVHTPHHHLGETGEEKKFVDHENYLHRIETQKEFWEDETGRRMMKKMEKASAAPGSAEAPEAPSAAPHGGGSARAAAPVSASSSQALAKRVGNLRQRIAFSRSRNRQRGAALFK